ncbi:hypothetical protein ACU4GA_13790 [Methylobacterium oryzae CBMB20]
MLHYWTPAVRSAFFGSYGALSFARGARAAQGAYFARDTGRRPGTPGTRFFDLSQVLRDSYRCFVVGANLIWSPVKEFDIGVEAMYTRHGRRAAASSEPPGPVSNQNAAYVSTPRQPGRDRQAPSSVIQVARARAAGFLTRAGIRPGPAGRAGSAGSRFPASGR